MTPDRNLDHLYPPFATKIRALMAEADAWLAKHRGPGWRCTVIETFRPLARQKELYAQGRTTPGPVVTQCDGEKNPSRHQSSCAVDLAPAKNGMVKWDDQEYWNYQAHLARKYGLTAGHDWTSVDSPHIECAAWLALAKAWQKLKGLR